MSTPWYGHRFVLQHNPIPRSKGGMRIIIEFDTGEEPDHWGLKAYEPILEMLQACRRDGSEDVVLALQTFKPERYTPEIQPPLPCLPEERGPLIDLGNFEIEVEFHGEPMRDNTGRD